MKKLFFTALLSLLVVGVYAQKKTLKSAQKALNKKDYATAQTLATQASENAETAENPQVYVILGTANVYMFKEDKTDVSKAQAAYDHFQKAVELGGDKVKEKLMEQVIMNNEGERLGGGEGFLFLQNMLNVQGNIYFESEDYENAYNYFLISSNIVPDDVVMAFYVGYSAYQSEKDEETIKYYEKVIELNDAAPEESKFANANFAYNGLIDVYLARRDDFDNALKYIGLAKEAFPEEKLYKDYEIEVLIKAEKMDEAIDALKKEVEEGVADESTLYTLAYLQWNNQEIEEALIAADKALEMNPNYYDALYVAGTVHFNLAVETLKAANNTDPSDTAGYDKLLAEAKEKFKTAMPYFEKALEQKPEDTYSLNPLSTIYDQLDMDAKRDAIFERLKAINGEN